MWDPKPMSLRHLTASRPKWILLVKAVSTTHRKDGLGVPQAQGSFRPKGYH